MATWHGEPYPGFFTTLFQPNQVDLSSARIATTGDGIDKWSYTFEYNPDLAVDTPQYETCEYSTVDVKCTYEIEEEVLEPSVYLHDAEEDRWMSNGKFSGFKQHVEAKHQHNSSNTTNPFAASLFAALAAEGGTFRFLEDYNAAPLTLTLDEAEAYTLHLAEVCLRRSIA